jgi:ABC-type multidrug transport system ATPase subunit/ABC-type multidrug transport system permease subunit
VLIDDALEREGDEPGSGAAGVTAAPDAVSQNGARRPGLRIEASKLGQRIRGRTILHDVSLTAEPGELVAVVGASGSGKTTLLEALAGVRPAARGTVFYDYADYYADIAAFRSSLGYVPQDDIIHRELSLAKILQYAAQLRLPAGTPQAAVDDAVAEVLRVLGLTKRADVPVGQLSGGQRKRASIAVELLPRPRGFFLDEPTSGLDPATAADFVGQLRRIADTGATVVFTTHNPADVAPCDQVVFLAQEGHLAFAGTPEDACRYFETTSIDDIYQRLADDASPLTWSQRFQALRAAAGGNRTQLAAVAPPTLPRPHTPAPTAAGRSPDAGGGTPAAPAPTAHGVAAVGPLRQWALLTRRNVDILTSNKLTLAILVGSPISVLLMIVVLFRPDAFDTSDPSPNATVMILFWLAFGAFFFGLTYGLLQICAEIEILRRERFVGLKIGPYLLAKLAVLLPLLAVVDAAMLGVLRATNRLPAENWATYGSLFVSLLLSSAAALALGLLASAAVSEPGQATMALPMLCFPQVLFSGAILPVPTMAQVGKAISFPLSTRWTFEGLGKDIDLNHLWAFGDSPLGQPLLASYGDTFTRAVAADWMILAAFTLFFLGYAWVLLARKTRGRTRAAAGGQHRQDVRERDRRLEE